MWETNLVLYVPPMTSKLSRACNMSLRPYQPLPDGPTTIVCHTFQEIASGSVMSGICWFVCRVHRERAHAGRSPCNHEHTAVNLFLIRCCSVTKIMGKMPTKMKITWSSWPTCNGPWWGHSWWHSKAIPMKYLTWLGRGQDVKYRAK